MGSDRLDAQLGPVAEFLLIIIGLLVVAAITAYLLSRAVQRRRERVHGKLSGSRRTKHSKIDLFAKPDDLPPPPAEAAAISLPARVAEGSTSSSAPPQTLAKNKLPLLRPRRWKNMYASVPQHKFWTRVKLLTLLRIVSPT